MPKGDLLLKELNAAESLKNEVGSFKILPIDIFKKYLDELDRDQLIACAIKVFLENDSVPKFFKEIFFSQCGLNEVKSERFDFCGILEAKTQKLISPNSVTLSINIDANLLERILLKAAIDNHMGLVKFVMDNFGIENITKEKFGNALMLGVYEGHADLVDFFIQKDQELNFFSMQRYETALLWTIRKGHEDVTRVIIDRKFATNSEFLKEAFVSAADRGVMNVLEYIMNLPAFNLDLQTRSKALMGAISNSQSEVVSLLTTKAVKGFFGSWFN